MDFFALSLKPCILNCSCLQTSEFYKVLHDETGFELLCSFDRTTVNEINIQFKQQINNINLILSGSEERLSVFDEKRNESFLLVGLQQFLAQVT